MTEILASNFAIVWSVGSTLVGVGVVLAAVKTAKEDLAELKGRVARLEKALAMWERIDERTLNILQRMNREER